MNGRCKKQKHHQPSQGHKDGAITVRKTDTLYAKYHVQHFYQGDARGELVGLTQVAR